MKKLILGLLLIAGIGLGTKAQTPVIPTSNPDPVPVYTGTPDPVPVYVAPTRVAVIVPDYTDRMFRVHYPAANRTIWYHPYDNWYRVVYVDNGPWYSLGYDDRGISYPISLPVLENAIPGNVVDAVMNRFTSVYDITETIGSDSRIQYLVRTVDDNGQMMTLHVNADAMDVPQ